MSTNASKLFRQPHCDSVRRTDVLGEFSSGSSLRTSTTVCPEALDKRISPNTPAIIIYASRGNSQASGDRTSENCTRPGHAHQFQIWDKLHPHLQSEHLIVSINSGKKQFRLYGVRNPWNNRGRYRKSLESVPLRSTTTTLVIIHLQSQSAGHFHPDLDWGSTLLSCLYISLKLFAPNKSTHKQNCQGLDEGADSPENSVEAVGKCLHVRRRHSVRESN